MYKQKDDQPHRHKLTLELELEQDCPKEVILWNYYDHEHLLGTHQKLYREARILAEQDDWALVYRRSKIPIVPFQNEGIGFQYMKEPHIMRTIHKDSVGFILDMEVHFFDLPEHRSRMKIIYNVFVPRWMAFLEPAFKIVFRSWLKNAWAEDVPMRNRRWKMHQLGFKDFHGIDWINNKQEKPADLDTGAYVFDPPVASMPMIRNEGMLRPDISDVEINTPDYDVSVKDL